ncbi:MAG: hypothetical protein MJ252_17490 [archaeon]|nr:hypothetical protein [archaeon]
MKRKGFNLIVFGVLFLLSITYSQIENEDTNKNIKLEEVNLNEHKENFLYIETSVSEGDLMKIFKEKNFSIIQSINPEIIKTVSLSKETNLKKENDTLKNKKESPNEPINDTQPFRGPFITGDNENYIDQISDDEKEKNHRKNHPKSNEFDTEEDNYYSLIDYKQKVLLSTNISLPTDGNLTEGDVTEESFAVAYSLITFFIVLTLAIIGFRYVNNCEKSSTDGQMIDNAPKQELFLY